MTGDTRRHGRIDDERPQTNAVPDCGEDGSHVSPAAFDVAPELLLTGDGPRSA